MRDDGGAVCCYSWRPSNCMFALLPVFQACLCGRVCCVFFSHNVAGCWVLIGGMCPSS